MTDFLLFAIFSSIFFHNFYQCFKLFLGIEFLSNAFIQTIPSIVVAITINKLHYLILIITIYCIIIIDINYSTIWIIIVIKILSSEGLQTHVFNLIQIIHPTKINHIIHIGLTIFLFLLIHLNLLNLKLLYFLRQYRLI